MAKLYHENKGRQIYNAIPGNAIRLEVEPGLPVIQGDHLRLVEVMQNLVSNAAKFMGNQPEPHIKIGTRGIDEAGRAILYVRDNGIGIDPVYHERIFGLFNRLDPGIEGTSIGLAPVKRILEVHGGRIWIESAPGEGAVFLFTLPGTPSGATRVSAGG